MIRNRGDGQTWLWRRSAGAAALLLAAVLAWPLAVWAVKADPKPHLQYQPDGTPVMVQMAGDERICFFETEGGYTIVRGTGGWWVYADPASGRTESLQGCSLRAGIDAVPEGWPRHIRPRIPYEKFSIPMRPKNDGTVKRLFLSCGHGTSGRQQSSGSPEAINPTPLTLPVLVIPVDFSDTASRHTTGPNTPVAGEPGYEPIPGMANSSATWQLLFGDGSIAGGLNHYYDESCDGVTDPLNHIWSHQWAIDKAVTVDGKTIPLGHSYSINPEFEPALNRGVSPPAVTDKWFGVGVYAHEGFHTLGGPDVYDYDYDATVAGEWDLMDNGSYNGVKSGTNPSHMGAPLKFDIELANATDSYGWIYTAAGINLEAGITGSTAVLYFLVTGDNGSGAEGPLGTASGGTIRTADSICDP